MMTPTARSTPPTASPRFGRGCAALPNDPGLDDLLAFDPYLTIDDGGAGLLATAIEAALYQQLIEPFPRQLEPRRRATGMPARGRCLRGRAGLTSIG